MKPLALDLFCGGGGATKGLQLAGFHVTGVDSKPQKDYCGDAFYQGDALGFPIDGYDFIWASPPCQAFTRLRSLNGKRDYPNLIPQTRARLIAAGVPFSIENVEGAPLGDTGNLILLCGTMFGLETKDGRAELRRHRIFETSFSIPLRPQCQHSYAPAISVVGQKGTPGLSHAWRAVLTVVSKRRAISVTGSTPQTNIERNRVRETFTVQQAHEAMGIDWLPMKTLSQAIPPAYSEFIGRQIIDRL